jgi:hypothetical protein
MVPGTQKTKRSVTSTAGVFPPSSPMTLYFTVPVAPPFTVMLSLAGTIASWLSVTSAGEPVASAPPSPCFLPLSGDVSTPVSDRFVVPSVDIPPPSRAKLFPWLSVPPHPPR